MTSRCVRTCFAYVRVFAYVRAFMYFYERHSPMYDEMAAIVNPEGFRSFEWFRILVGQWPI